MKARYLTEIAALIGARCSLKGEDLLIRGLSALEHATSEEISFLRDPKYRKALKDTRAGAVILSPAEEAHSPVSCLVMDAPEIGFAKAAALFDHTPLPRKGVHPTAIIHPSVEVPEDISIGPFVVIEEGVRLAPGVMIEAGCVIGAFSVLGENTHLKARVVLYHRVKIGARCLIHSGVILGSDGFGLVNEQGRWIKIPQLGALEIHDEVEVGANTTVDRGALANTVIHQGVKIDNQVHIAHNVVIGEGTAMAAQVGIAGSTEVGRHCLLAGKVGLNGHIRLADQVIVTAMSGVSHDLKEPGIYSASLPAKPLQVWNKTLARLNRLGLWFERIKILEHKKDAS